MNILLWTLQIALAFLAIAGGCYKITNFDLLQADVASMRELPRYLWMFLGGIECLGGLGLILPGLFKVLPMLTPIAAVVVAEESVLVTSFYINFGDRAPLPYSVTMAIMAVIIAYGRFNSMPDKKAKRRKK